MNALKLIWSHARVEGQNIGIGGEDAEPEALQVVVARKAH